MMMILPAWLEDDHIVCGTERGRLELCTRWRPWQCGPCDVRYKGLKGVCRQAREEDEVAAELLGDI